VAIHGTFDFNAMLVPSVVRWVDAPAALVVIVPIVDVLLIAVLVVAVTRAYRAAVQAEAEVYMPVSPRGVV